VSLDLLIKQKDLIETFDFGVCIVENDLTVLYWNCWLEEQSMFSKDFVFQKKLSDIFDEINTKDLQQQLNTAIESKSKVAYTSKYGYLLPIQIDEEHRVTYSYMQQIVTFYPIDTTHVLITIYDQTSQLESTRKSVEEAIFQEDQKKMLIDKLTGLPNRLKLLKKLSTDEHKKLAIINISDFNAINNFYGYELGDRYLINVADRISEFTKRLGLELYKLPSDEYAIYKANQENFTNERFLEDILAITQTLEYEYYEDEEDKIPIFFDVGISFEDDNIFKKADIALKESKKTKKQFVVFDESMSIDSLVQERNKWHHILRDAIDNQRVYPFYQPIYNFHTKKIEKYESLIRLIDAQGKVVSPFFFLDVAKQAKLYHELTNIVMRHAFKTFKDTDYEFSINMSIEDIMYEPTVKLLKDLLQKNPKTAERLVIELLEDEGIEKFDLVNDFITQMRAYNVRFAIDDFGTGYSNFSYLLELNIDYLKIDASLIKNVDKDENSQKIVETLVDFASKIGAKVISEFVSKESVFNKVKELNIDYAQGYYIDQPRETIGNDPVWKE